MIVDEFKKSILSSIFKGDFSKSYDTDSKIDEYLEKIRLFDKIKRKDLNKNFEIPFNIPNNWRWVQLGDVCGIYGGKRIPAGRKLVEYDTGHKYIRVSDMNDYTVELDNIMYVPEDIYPTIKNYTISKEDLYITVAGTIGKVGWIPEQLDGANLTENANKIVFSDINKKWLYYLLISPVVQSQISDMTTKVGQPKLAIKRICNILIPIAPFEEQERIVRQLEQLFNDLEEIRPIEEKLTKLKRDFPNEMKKAILKSAIEGKLSIQNDSENAQELVENAINEKNNAVKNKKSKMVYNSNKKIILDFEIPSNWRKVCIGEIADITSGGTPQRTESSYWNGTIPWLKIGDINGKYISECSEFITEAGLKNSSAKWFEAGTILYTIFATIGTVGILNFRATTNQAIAGITLFGNINKEYFYYVCVALKDVLISKGRGCAQMNINQEILNNVEIPIPPLEEQIRIVNKIEQLLPLCNDIEILANS